MNTQDNDIDELFRSKLGDVEIEPTERVWKGITQELDGTKRKRSLLPVFSAAASIALIIAAGIFYLMKPVKNKDQNIVNNRVNVRMHQNSIDENSDDTITNPSAKINRTETVVTAEYKPIKPKYTAAKSLTVITTQKKQVRKPLVTEAQSEQMAAVKTSQDNLKQEPTVLASASAEQVKANAPVVPDVTLAEAKPDTKETEAFATTNKTAATTPQIAEIKPAKTSTKKHGIKSFGDLINAVVAKVDKRPDKVIQFSNTDGDEATITGVNLGFIKVKAEK